MVAGQKINTWVHFSPAEPCRTTILQSLSQKAYGIAHQKKTSCRLSRAGCLWMNKELLDELAFDALWYNRTTIGQQQGCKLQWRAPPNDAGKTPESSRCRPRNSTFASMFSLIQTKENDGNQGCCSTDMVVKRCRYNGALVGHSRHY